jgi:hypothetical protein
MAAWTSRAAIAIPDLENSSNAEPPQESLMDDDLNRKDDHLTAHAALCNVEPGIEVTADDGIVVIDGTRKLDPALMNDCFELTPFQARLLSDALLEVARLAEGTCHEERA